MTREVVIVSGARTAIGTYGGSLKDIAPTETAAQIVREVLARAQVKGDEVGHVVFGHVVNTEPKDMYLSRVAAINGGCAESVPAFNVNRLCGSGLQAIVCAAQSIVLGDADIAIGGGAEGMSRAPYASLNMRWGGPHERHQNGGHGRGCAARSVQGGAHGRDGRKHCRQVGHYA